jgi:NAD(P)-dependent dehydrogenase (short-subunit alcohol dehydrogenase family)
MLICLTYEQDRRRAPEEVALWITLLLSPLASFMTGAVIPLDGARH